MMRPERLHVELVEGTDAERLLSDPVFDDEWARLLAQCPWATVFQSPPFAKVWYRVYREQRAPLLLIARDEDGTLCGLLAVATARGTIGALAHVGEHHAEYHAWLARPDLGNVFPPLALDALANRFPRSSLRLIFVPPGAPLEWLAPGCRWHAASDLRPLPRPLMAVGADSECEASLKKKSNRSRLNRLAREAEFRFVQLEGRQDLATHFAEIIDYTDLRQGAVHDSLPFRADPLKAELYLSLMAIPKLMHATVSLVGDRVAAAHVGARNGSSVQLGLITHSPFMASHSPGKLHLLLLGQQLGRQGYTDLDLTPGGEYKDRFATHADQAYVLDIFLSRASYARHTARQFAARTVKRALAAVDSDPRRARLVAQRVADRASRASLTSVTRRLARLVRTRTIGMRSEFRFYRIAAGKALAFPDETRLARNQLPDLLLFERARDLDFNRSSFLSTALERLETGQIVYTAAAGGKLLHFSWLIPHQEVSYSDYGQPLELPPGSAVAYDDYTYLAARGHGYHRTSIQQRTRDAANNARTEWIFAGVRADNPRSWRNFESLGFTVYCRCFRDASRGHEKLWIEFE